MNYLASTTLVDRIADGDDRSAGRLITRAESGEPEARDALAAIYRRAGAAHVIGLTGVPGSGKSTLVAKLTTAFRARGERVGIVAVDPSSPYSGGAILGDRIRMSELANDDGVFIRSMATRGAVGGMARAALDAVDILDVAGYRTVIVETVGVGQDEVEIALAADTTIVVSAPGLGDDVQAIKAGILEIADIHVVSKCDRDDADRTLADLKQMLALGATMASAASAWKIAVLGVSSYTGQGIDELAERIVAHRELLRSTPLGAERRARSAAFRLRKTAEALLLERFDRVTARHAAPLARALAQRAGDPYGAATTLIQTVFAMEATTS